MAPLRRRPHPPQSAGWLCSDALNDRLADLGDVDTLIAIAEMDRSL